MCQVLTISQINPGLKYWGVIIICVLSHAGTVFFELLCSHLPFIIKTQFDVVVALRCVRAPTAPHVQWWQNASWQNDVLVRIVSVYVRFYTWCRHKGVYAHPRSEASSLLSLVHPLGFVSWLATRAHTHTLADMQCLQQSLAVFLMGSSGFTSLSHSNTHISDRFAHTHTHTGQSAANVLVLGSICVCVYLWKEMAGQQS